MLKAKELQAPIERLLHALYRREASLISELAAAFSTEAQRRRVAQAKKRTASAGMTYELGAWEVLEALAIRANSRHARNAQVSVAKLRYALDVLQTLARSPRHQMSPTVLTNELLNRHVDGVHANNVSRLIARLKDANLIVAHEGSNDDARTKPVLLTEAGLNILEALRPGWRTDGKPQSLEGRRIGERMYFKQESSPEPIELTRKRYPSVVTDPAGPAASDAARIARIDPDEGLYLDLRRHILPLEQRPAAQNAERRRKPRARRKHKTVSRVLAGAPLSHVSEKP